MVKKTSKSNTPKLTSFAYNGPVNCLTIEGKEITLTPGKSYDLPAGNSQVIRLVTLNFLTTNKDKDSA